MEYCAHYTESIGNAYGIIKSWNVYYKCLLNKHGMNSGNFGDETHGKCKHAIY